MNREFAEYMRRSPDKIRGLLHWKSGQLTLPNPEVLHFIRKARAWARMVHPKDIKKSGISSAANANF